MLIEVSLEHLDGGQWVADVIGLNLDKDMGLSEESLDKDMMGLPRLIAYYADLAAELHAQAARKKQRIELTESVIAQEIRKVAIEDKEKLTEPGIKERVASDPQVAQAHQDFFTADSDYRKVDGFYRSLREKASLAIALCYKQKAEIQNMGTGL